MLSSGLMRARNSVGELLKSSRSSFNAGETCDSFMQICKNFESSIGLKHNEDVENAILKCFGQSYSAENNISCARTGDVFIGDSPKLNKLVTRRVEFLTSLIPNFRSIYLPPYTQNFNMEAYIAKELNMKAHLGNIMGTHTKNKQVLGIFFDDLECYNDKENQFIIQRLTNTNEPVLVFSNSSYPDISKLFKLNRCFTHQNSRLNATPISPYNFYF